METTTISHQEWLAQRRTGLGGSDIGSILGLNAHKTPLQLWLEKTGRKEDNVDNNYTRAGKKLEPVVADWFSEKTGLDLVNLGNVVQRHKIHDFILGTPDRITLDAKERKNGVLEIKTTGEQIDRENPPLPWFCQVNWYAGIKKSYGVTDCTTNYIAWFERLTCNFDYIELAYDPGFVDFMINKAGEFWHNHVLADTPPEPINNEDVQALYRKHQPGKIIMATPELEEIIQHLHEVRSAIKDAEKEEELLKYQIQLAMADAECVMVGDQPAITWKAAKDSLDYDTKRLIEENPDLALKYQVQKIGSRRFLLKS